MEKAWAMKRLWIVVLLLSGIFVLADRGLAAGEYVTDSFEITFRSAPGNDKKIIRMLSSGQQVDVLTTDGEWSLVRLPGGDKEGWVVSRYLISRLPWEIQAKSLQGEVANLRAKLSKISEESTASSKQRRDLIGELNARTQELEQLRKEHSELQRGAGGYLKLKALYAAAENNLSTTRNELSRVAQENEKIRSSQVTWWFVSGALVLLCGLLIGVLIGRQQKRRKSSYV
jgi:SH3 domain protein